MRRVNKNNKYNYNYRDKKDTRVSSNRERISVYNAKENSRLLYIIILIITVTIIIKCFIEVSGVLIYHSHQLTSPMPSV